MTAEIIEIIENAEQKIEISVNSAVNFCPVKNIYPHSELHP
jgi:hypothetical protein